MKEIPVEFIGTSTEAERSAFAQGASVPTGAFIEPSLEDNTVRVFMPDAIDAVLAARLQRHEAKQPGYSDMWAEINTRLTAIDGLAAWVEDSFSETMLPHLLTAGELVHEDVDIVRAPGAPNRCHANVTLLYQAGQLRQIFSGYAFHRPSGFWFEHSWGMNARRQLVETTPDVHWSAYYGAPWDVRLDSSPERQRRAAEKRARRAERNRRLAGTGSAGPESVAR